MITPGNLLRSVCALIIGTLLLYGGPIGIILTLGANVLLIFAHTAKRKVATSCFLIALQFPLAITFGYRAISTFQSDFLGWALLCFALVVWGLLLMNVAILSLNCVADQCDGSGRLSSRNG